MNKILLIAAVLNLPLSLATTEQTLGNVKAIKITQKVSVSECQNNFKQLEFSSFCKVQAWEPRDTDLFITQSDSVGLKIEESDGKHLNARLLANVNGYYLFTFERKNEYGLSKSITLAEATPLMEALTAQLNSGELFWKIYRVQEN
ncbi:MAG: hypothetical protein R3A80_02640 [Bdellovibrionota bacterium]